MRSTIRSDDGQASVEHLGLMALVAAVLLSAAAIAGAASPGIRNAVWGGFEHALCVVTGQACEALAREPCPTLRTVKTTSQGLSISYARLGHDKVLAIERRSDGTYELSVIEGFQTGAGDSIERGQGAATMSADGKFMLGHRAGRTYEAATPQEAKALAERLRKEHFTEARTVVAGAADLLGLAAADPAVKAYVLAGDGAAEALGRFGLGGLLEGGGKAGGRSEVGVKIAAHEQQITAYWTWDARAEVFFEALNEIAAPVGRRPTSSAGSNGGGAGRGIDLSKPGAAGAADRDARARVSVKNPLAQKVEGEAMMGGSMALQFGPGPELQGIEIVGYAGVNGRQREIRARLDPSDPEVRAALSRLQHDPGSPTAIAELGRAAADRSAIDVRTFDTKRTEHPHGLGYKGDAYSLELGFGSTTDVSALTDQRSRPPGGEWEQRTDCVAAVNG